MPDHQGGSGDGGVRVIDNSAASTRSKVLAYANRGLDTRPGDSDRAIADYSQAIRLDSSYASAYSNRGQLYYARKDNDRAIADFNDAIRLDPRDANAYYSRGLAKRARGDAIGASSDIAAAKRLNPSVGN
jgi:tetratricopeptide (TPR) repeat protein